MAEKKSKKKPKKTKTRKTILNKSKFPKLFRDHSCNISKTCEALKMGRETFYGWMRDDPKFKQKIRDAEEAEIDWAEGQLKKLMSGVVLPEDKIFCHQGDITVQPTKKHYVPDNASIIFFLKTKGKDRGYVENNENSPLRIDLNELAEKVIEQDDPETE